jgi:hypothetical protein
LIVIFPVANYSDDLFEFLGYESAVADTLTNLQTWLAPSLLLKMICDNMKTFLHCHQRYFITGVISAISIAVVFPLAYFKCAKGTVDCASLGTVMIVYQIVNLIMCIVGINMSFNESEQKEFCELKYCIRLEMDWFTWEFLKNSFTEYYSAVLKTIIVTIVALTGSKMQIATFDDLYFAFKILLCVSYGFWVYPRVKINTINGTYLQYKKDPNPQVNNGLDFFKQLLKAMSLVAVTLSIIMSCICYLMTKNLRSEIQRTLIASVILLFGICSFLAMLIPFM